MQQGKAEMGNVLEDFFTNKSRYKGRKENTPQRHKSNEAGSELPNDVKLRIY